MIDYDDFIYIDSWKRLVRELGSPFIYHQLDDILFEEIPPNKILVTGSCDYCLCEQAEYHPNHDLTKYVHATDWRDLSGIKDRYVSYLIRTVNEQNCSPNHKYSLKTERYTWETLPDIPNVKRWFTTNCNIYHPAVTLLPFGLNSDEPLYPPEIEKTSLLYINFQLNSLIRVQIMEHFEKLLIKNKYANWFTLQRSPHVPFRRYISELASHKYCLCPPGNAFDSYRIWEALYCGVVPILTDSKFSRQLLAYGLPVVITPDYKHINKEDLEAMNPPVGAFDNEVLKVSYWRERFSQLARP